MTGFEETIPATLGENNLGPFLSLLSELAEAVRSFFAPKSVETLM
jgi:hypothetical protein